MQVRHAQIHGAEIAVPNVDRFAMSNVFVVARSVSKENFLSIGCAGSFIRKSIPKKIMRHQKRLSANRFNPKRLHTKKV
jgi:hypothetical protein